MRRSVASILMLLVACTSARPEATSTPDPEPAPAPSSAASSAAPSPDDVAETRVPRPNEPIPRRADVLARVTRDLYRDLYAGIERWTAAGTPRHKAGARALALRSLYLQRIMRVLARAPRLAGRVVARLPRRLRVNVRANVAAGARLFALSGVADKIPDFRYARPASPKRLRVIYDVAARRYDIPWHVLAAVNFVESKFGRVLGPSTAGALGPMQFLPATWEQYGAGGDILDPRDSILAAARYLQASGAAGSLRAALFAYNPTEAYVDAIEAYAREIERDPRNFYIYYFWQVFVTTRRRDVQLTGPGSAR